MAKTSAKASANETVPAVQEAQADQETKTVPAVQEAQNDKEENAEPPGTAATYTVKELIEASEKALGVPRECAVTAFKLKKAERLTLSAAKKIVEEFMGRKVK